MIRIAIIVPGGVAGTGLGIQSPPLRSFIADLSRVIDVTVYSLRYSPTDPPKDRCGSARIVNVQAAPSDPFPEQLLALGAAIVTDHRRNPYDLLHGFWALPCGFATVILAKLLNIPSAVTLLGGETANIRTLGYGNMTRLHSRWATLLVCRNVKSLIVLTKFQAKYLRTRGVSRKIEVVPFGADVRRFNLRSVRHPVPPFRILHVGNLTGVKGQELLLRTFAELRRQVEATLTIIGPDYMNGRLQRMAKSLGLNGNVRFTGRKDYEAIPSAFRKADLLLHTPLHEAQGMVIMEACASGVPPAGTLVGLLADLREQFPAIVHGERERDLANEMVRIFRERRRYKSLQQSLRSWAEHHDSQWTVREYTRIYASLMSNP